MEKRLDPDRIIRSWMRIQTPDPVKWYGSESGFASLKGAQQAADTFNFIWLLERKRCETFQIVRYLQIISFCSGVRIRNDFYFLDLAVDLLPHLSSKFLAVVFVPANEPVFINQYVRYCTVLIIYMVPVQLVPVLELLSSYCWVRYPLFRNCQNYRYI